MPGCDAPTAPEIIHFATTLSPLHLSSRSPTLIQCATNVLYDGRKSPRRVVPLRCVTCVPRASYVLDVCVCCSCDLQRVSLDACDECVWELVLVGALIECLHYHSLTTGIATSQHYHHLARLDAAHDDKRYNRSSGQDEVSDGTPETRYERRWAATLHSTHSSMIHPAVGPTSCNRAHVH